MCDTSVLVDLVVLGVIGTPRGIKGNVRIKSFPEVPEDIAAYGPLWNAQATRSFSLSIVGERQGYMIAHIDGVNDRNAAKALKGAKLHVDRAKLPPPAKGSFYHVDLIGLNAVTEKGDTLGTVSAVFNHGAGDVLEIEGGTIKNLVVSFTREVVQEVDIASGKLVIKLPDEDNELNEVEDI